MGLVIAASSIAFVTTEMDDLLVMFILLSKDTGRLEKSAIVLGKYLGLLLLVAAGKMAAALLSVLPCEQLLGLLGFMPIVIGIRFAVREFAGERGGEGKPSALLRSLSVAAILLESFVITLANGGDNIAVYASFFPSLSGNEFVLSCVVFAVMQAVWCVIAISVINAESIRSYIEESKGVIVPALYVSLGLYILIKSGTVVWLFSRQSIPL
ncbi:MAG: cadmium resistance transporter [Treponema sp.]|nr:cadmium resistance transporter [Treponema sp.]MBQ6568311.1 cadmium resistance transporter [Treponema sp.]MBQ7167677.1 cadmium resistance transporter [Treponema sp.]